MIEIKTVKKSGLKKLRLKSMYKEFEEILIRYSKNWINQDGYLYFINANSYFWKPRYEEKGFEGSFYTKASDKIIEKYRFYLDFGVRSNSDNQTKPMESLEFITWLINSRSFSKLIQYFEERNLIKVI